MKFSPPKRRGPSLGPAPNPRDKIEYLKYLRKDMIHGAFRLYLKYHLNIARLMLQTHHALPTRVVLDTVEIIDLVMCWHV